MNLPIRRWVRRGLAGLGIVLGVVGATAWAWLDQTLPQTRGDLAIPGLERPIAITRDGSGVPTIRAATATDAWFAFGFVEAQDRLFQMDLQRRLGQGRLAELYGPALVPIDRQMRILGLASAAATSLPAQGPEFTAVLEAYTAGVNAWIDRQPRLPVDFALLGYRPERWTPTDCLIIGKLVELELGGDFRRELLRARLAAKLAPDELEQLLPGFDPGRQPIPAEWIEIYRQLPLDRMLRALPPMIGPAPMARDWAVDGRHSATGKPLLAENPPLDPPGPGLWYLARLEAPDLDIAGAGLPGSPVIRLGHDGRIAWSVAPILPDAENLFIERLDPDDPGRYQTPEGSAGFEAHREIIRVRGAADQSLTIRRTRHGPVISDAVATEAASPYVVALSATFLQTADRSEEAQWSLGQASDWEGFEAAGARLQAPRADLIYADTAGHIGVTLAGIRPPRVAGDGNLPVPGWSDADDAVGRSGPEISPPEFDPPSGRVGTGAAGADQPLPETIDGSAADSAGQSISQSTERMREILSPTARHLLRLLLAVPPVGDRQREAEALLGRWDGRMDDDGPGPVIFTAWLSALDKRIYADELGELFPDLVRSNPLLVETVLTRFPRWCDDVSTPEVESCAVQISAGLDDALRGLRRRYGTDMAGWRRATRPTTPWLRPLMRWFSTFRAVSLAALSPPPSREVLAEGGRRALARLYIAGAGLRAIYDLSDLERSVFMISPGESGNRLSPHYDDLAPLWQGFEWLRLPREAKGETLRLVPPK